MAEEKKENQEASSEEEEEQTASTTSTANDASEAEHTGKDEGEGTEHLSTRHAGPVIQRSCRTWWRSPTHGCRRP